MNKKTKYAKAEPFFTSIRTVVLFFLVAKKAPSFSTHPDQNNKSVYIKQILNAVMGQSPRTNNLSDGNEFDLH